MPDQIDLSQFSSSSLQDMLNAFTEMQQEHPDVFYAGAAEITQYGNQYTLTVDYLNYSPTDIMRYENKVSEILTNCIKPDMDDFEKALVLHDYISLHCNYDYESSHIVDADPHAGRTLGGNAYTALVNELAVCQGYSEAYMDLLQRCGIQCILILNRNHAWNQVYLYGNWYHVDTTWDHPATEGQPDLPGRVLHENFLSSDAAIIATGHSNWTGGFTCSDSGYENAFCRSTKSSVIYDDQGYCYYLMDSASDSQDTIRLVKRERTTGASEILFEQQETWDIPDSNSFWTGIFSYLTEYNGDLFFNGKTSIYRMDLNSTDVYEAYEYSGNGYLLGCKAADNKLTVITGYDLNNLRDLKTIAISDLLHISHQASQVVPTAVPTAIPTVAPAVTAAVPDPGIPQNLPVITTVPPAQQNPDYENSPESGSGIIIVIVAASVTALIIIALIVLLILNSKKKQKRQNNSQMYNYSSFGNPPIGGGFSSTPPGGSGFGYFSPGGSGFGGSSSGASGFGSNSPSSGGSGFAGSSSSGSGFGSNSPSSGGYGSNSLSSGGYGYGGPGDGNSGFSNSSYNNYPGYAPQPGRKNGLFSQKK
ncbi:MAG: hypothetical protein KBT01_00945 [Clostridiales bacterium]|nr:hypothetical protein [Candidatus Blautia equi]